MNWLRCLWWRWRVRRIRRLLENPRIIAALRDQMESNDRKLEREFNHPNIHVKNGIVIANDMTKDELQKRLDDLQRRYENGQP